jgi:hypothetical protein
MKYLRHINESIKDFWATKFKDNIDWNIIDDAKDMSLEYLDENVNNVLLIEIQYEMFSRYVRNNLNSIDIYSCTYRYKNLKEEWDPGEDLSTFKIDANNIKYSFYIYEILETDYQDVETIKMEETYEIQERLKSLYHDKIGDIIAYHNDHYSFARRKPLKDPYDGKLHESVSNNEIVLTLREILLDLEDVGYEIMVDSFFETRVSISLGQKGIAGFGNNLLNFFIKTEDIRNETILRIMDYIDQCGWKWIAATNEEGKKNWNISYVFGPKSWINK